MNTIPPRADSREFTSLRTSARWSHARALLAVSAIALGIGLSSQARSQSQSQEGAAATPPAVAEQRADGVGRGPGQGMGQGMRHGMGQGMGPGMGPGMAQGMGWGEGPRAERHGGEMRGYGQRHGHAHGKGRGEHGGWHATMRALDLTEAQRDQLFELRHAQAPAMREQMKAIRSAQRELRQLAMAQPYDAARAEVLARELGTAIAERTRMGTETRSKFYAMLTPEQREKLQTMRGQHRRS